jgi:hypothetical protein
MSNVPGQADHGGTRASFSIRVRTFAATARKAIVAFLATGVGVAFSDSLAHFDFSHLTLGNLWSGLGVGLVSGVLTYVVRNEGSKLGISPELADLIARVVNERLATTEQVLWGQITSTSQALVGHVNSVSGNLSSHVTEQVEALRPRKAVRGPGGKFQPADTVSQGVGDGRSISDPGHD